MLSDFRFAFRQLRRSPSLSIAAILCFALGIGANTSIFSVVDAVMFRPLPFPNADRLVLVGEALPRFSETNFGVISAPEFADYQRLDGHVFQASAIYESGAYGLSGSGEPERVTGLKASSSILPVLGVHAARGRDLGADDDRVGSPDALMISDALWRRRFGADPATVGKPIDVDGRSYVVAGVLPASFRFPLAGVGGQPADIIIPYRITADVERERADNYSTYFIARLAPGVSLSAARKAVAALAAQLPTLHPAVYGSNWKTLADAFPLRDHAVEKVRAPMIVLLAAVGFVLLIACINVSSLLLARAAARHREISVRRALGASRGRLVRQFLAESFVLVAAGSVLGVAMAVWCIGVIARHAPDALLQGYDVSLDARALALTAAITIVTAIAFSLVPALQTPGASLSSSLRDADRSTGSAAHQRGRRMLVITEIALALMLATGASLMIRSLGRARAVDPGFDPSHVLTFRLQLPEFRYATPASVSQFESSFLQTLGELPGARVVSATTHLPMTEPSRIAFAVEGANQSKIPFASSELVMPDYFAAMRIPLHQGRYFTASDDEHGTPVAIINETLARQYFPKTDPIGKRIKWGSPSSPDPWTTIVGITTDVHTDGVDQPELPAIYFPIRQHDVGVANTSLALERDLTYLVRTTGEPTALMNAVRRAVRQADPALPIIALQPMTNVVSTSMSSRQFNTVLLTTFSLLALVLASAGIYGLMAYAVVQRTREIGIRLAIGARPADVLRLVVGQAARIAGVGLLIGLAGALALTRLLSALLFDVSPLDPVAFAASAGVLLAVATLASYLPARRAAAIDPQRAIRID